MGWAGRRPVFSAVFAARAEDVRRQGGGGVWWFVASVELALWREEGGRAVSLPSVGYTTL